MVEKSTKIALLQIATLDGSAYVIDVRKLNQSESWSRIATILEDNSITKMGSGCRYDASLMSKLFEFNVQNIFEISDLVAAVLTRADYEMYVGTKSGLKSLCNNLMGLDFQKLDWWEYEQFAHEVLPSKLVNYAALDVITLIDLYLNLFCYHHKYDSIKNSTDVDKFATEFGRFNVEQFRMFKTEPLRICLRNNFKYWYFWYFENFAFVNWNLIFEAFIFASP